MGDKNVHNSMLGMSVIGPLKKKTCASNQVEFTCFHHLGIRHIVALGGVLAFVFLVLIDPTLHSSVQVDLSGFICQVFQEALGFLPLVFEKSWVKQCIQCLHISVAGNSMTYSHIKSHHKWRSWNIRDERPRMWTLNVTICCFLNFHFFVFCF